jgi:hypothetical protein
MTRTRTTRTLAATGITAAVLCALPAVGQTVAAGDCGRMPDGQEFIDWARARSSQNHLALPDRQPRSLRTLLGAVDSLPETQGFIEWARAQGSHNDQTQAAGPIRRAQPLHRLIDIAATDGN